MNQQRTKTLTNFFMNQMEKAADIENRVEAGQPVNRHQKRFLAKMQRRIS